MNDHDTLLFKREEDVSDETIKAANSSDVVSSEVPDYIPLVIVKLKLPDLKRKKKKS